MVTAESSLLHNSEQPDSNQETLVSELKSLTINLPHNLPHNIDMTTVQSFTKLYEPQIKEVSNRIDV